MPPQGAQRISGRHREDGLDLDGDKTNGFTCVQANVADVGSTAQLGCLLYVLGEARQADTPVLNPSALV